MTTIYGIKNCDTVKKARKWLDAHDINYSFHDFRVEGINEDMIKLWLETQPLEKLVNKRSTSWKALSDEEKNALSVDTAPALCVQYETLIKRPLLAVDDDIHLGFNDKSYTAIFA
ncbi:MAG: arsenate reductase [Pseudomonadales bacterium]|nr:arsenate reductase [Pseudomonadales bacterium]